MRAGPVEQQLAKDLEKSLEETRSRLERQEKVLKSGDTQEFEKVSARFRNFLMTEMEQAMQRMEKEVRFLEDQPGWKPEYHRRIEETAREAMDLMQNESLRLNNAIKQARQRLDHGDDPGQVGSELLEVEEAEEKNLREADRKVSRVLNEVAEHRTWIPYLVRRTRRKLGRKQSTLLKSWL